MKHLLGSKSMEQLQTTRKPTRYGPYPGIPDSELTVLSPTQRSAFFALVSVLCLLSVCGNVGTLHVNFRRKIRPFFRACLISLAFSDLMSTVFMAVAYLSQFTTDYVQIWVLGKGMCQFVPFVTTAAILASSMTLVGIALDRYFAVMKALIGFWKPGWIFCVVCMFGIWMAAIGISSPMFRIYTLFPFYILADDQVDAAATTTSWEANASPGNLTDVLVEHDGLVAKCISEKEDVWLYYMVLFGIIFIPSIIAFVWLNTIIARKIWRRRHNAAACRQLRKSTTKLSRKKECETLKLKTQHSKDKNPNPNTLLNASCICRTAHSTQKITVLCPCKAKLAAPPTTPICTQAQMASCANRTREFRHIRMFTIIILMMAVFIFFRLPAWVFMIMRIYGTYSKPVHWIIYFSFGVLNLTSCVLNPLFYTFLAETIQCAIFVKGKVCNDLCGLRFCCRRYQHRTCPMPPRPTASCDLPEETPTPDSCCTNCCMDFGMLHVPCRCTVAQQANSMSVVVEQEPKSTCEQDEGVDCSDDGDSTIDFCECSQHIYTIFPPSLVTSSIDSQCEDMMGNISVIK